MALTEYVFSPSAVLAIVGLVLSSYIFDYFVTNGKLRGIPAPFGAQFSNLWLLMVCRRGDRYKTVDEYHAKLGKVVRIQPNHVSIADDAAIPTIYGHGNGFLKS